jgi:CelD/BcsL family acetyltransferase involved in cellulose biosynthesis
LHLVLHREIPEDENLRTQWNELVQQMERPEVFYTYEWALAVNRAYHASLTPWLLLAYDEGSLVGLGALATGGTPEKTFFLANSTADYCDFVSHPRRRSELVEIVLAELRKLKMPTLVLANLPADSGTSRALRASARNHGYLLLSRPAYLCAQVVLRSSGQRISVKQSVQRKQNVRRNLDAMEKTAPVTLSHLKSGDQVALVLPRFFKAHVARFLATGRISNLARPERRLFLADLTRLLSRSGWLTHSRLMVGDQPVAWNYGFRFAGSWFWYQPTFDSRWQRFSPGICLLAKIVEEACDTSEINLVDLGLGAESYKERIATAARETLHVTATTSTTVYAKEALRYHVAAAIQSVPSLEKWVRAALSKVSLGRQRFHEEGARGFVSLLWSRAKESLVGQSEVLFFEWPGGAFDGRRLPPSLTLQTLDLELLAVAAMHYVDEPETLTYLLRAAKRLRSNQSQGFALVTAEGIPAHFCWVSDFENFYMSELDHKLKAPSADSVLVFDCWTPAAVRGHGYYGMAISRVASQLQASGKRPWIFSAATNVSSVRAVEKTGFVHRFSMTRRRFLFMSKVVHSEPYMLTKPLANSSAAD